MKRSLRSCILGIVAVLVLGGGPPQAAVAEKAARAAWQGDWDKAVSEAKKEGKLLIYTTHGPETRTALTSAFKKKFGMDAEFIGGQGGALSNRIFAERRSGLYTGDLFMGGTTDQLRTLKPNGALAPLKPLLILPDVLDKTAYFDDTMPWVDKEGVYILSYALAVANTIAANSELVKPSEIKGYADLLNPKWKDKLIMLDPTISGTSQVWFYVTAMVSMNPDFHRRLVMQNPVITRDTRLQVEWIAKGKYAIALAPYQERVGEFQRAAAPIKWVSPAEGTYLSPAGSVSHFDRAPHPNAAKVFVNWLLTKEGLTTWSQVARLQTVRIEVPTDFLLPQARRDPRAKYFNTATEDIRAKINAATALSKEIYGPLLK